MIKCYITAFVYGDFYDWGFVDIYSIELTFVNETTVSLTDQVLQDLCKTCFGGMGVNIITLCHKNLTLFHLIKANSNIS
ncbi:Uncharacterised protein [Clostridium perfringens]|nr:Uncharacterised protein [Clostridium perfringens]